MNKAEFVNELRNRIVDKPLSQEIIVVDLFLNQIINNVQKYYALCPHCFSVVNEPPAPIVCHHCHLSGEWIQ